MMTDNEVLAQNRTVELPYGGGEINWQTGPHAEGRNGLEMDEAIDVLLHRMGVMQLVLPCDENDRIIEYLDAAKAEVLARRARRDAEGVRGTLQAHTAS